MTDLTALLSAAEVFSVLDIPPGTKQLLAGYSGGLDSHVLLHLLHTYCHQSKPAPGLTAIHINHGLNPDAGHWAEHCRAICQELKIEYRLIELDARAPKGESQEAWARKLRYDALRQLVGPADILMTAHHQDDMAETLLIQLFRGSGPAGLAAMPAKSGFGPGRHYRPLLQYTRSDLKTYAEQHRLSWIEDDSNTDLKYDRNLIRNNILPAISQRWPAISRTLYRAARLQADAASLLDDLGNSDMQLCAVEHGNYLRVSLLQVLSSTRAANTVRYWIRSRRFPLPTERQLSEVFTSLLAAGPDTVPCVCWNGTELRRYRDTIFITAPLPDPPDPLLQIDWDMNTPCKLVMGTLQASRGRGSGIKASKCMNDHLNVRFRRTDTLIKMSGHHRQLRKLFQQYGIPPCYREYIPLLFAADVLIMIPGICIADDYLATADEEGWKIEWTDSATVCLGGPD